MTKSLIIIVLGLIAALYLYSNFPYAPKNKKVHGTNKISVIIPARNEEKNIALILSDLQKQSVQPFEIICVDDCSDDKTSEVVHKYGAKVIRIEDKPENWVGKSYACFIGAKEAKGDLFLFLDADVRLGREGISEIQNAHQENNCTVSFQPRHVILKPYENFSLFFNLIQFAANGLGIKNGENIGLIGPVILISRKDYEEIGGHESIKDSVIDDISLGLQLTKHNIPFKLFLGDNNISFRMYSNGFKDLFQGWMKNIASGATKTPFMRFLLIFLFITSCISAPLNIIIGIIELNLNYLLMYIVLYILWVLIFTAISRRIGNFSLCSLVFYPVPLTMFIMICILSFIKKVLHLKSYWKGRKV